MNSAEIPDSSFFVDVVIFEAEALLLCKKLILVRVVEEEAKVAVAWFGLQRNAKRGRVRVKSLVEPEQWEEKFM